MIGISKRVICGVIMASSTAAATTTLQEYSPFIGVITAVGSVKPASDYYYTGRSLKNRGFTKTIKKRWFGRKLLRHGKDLHRDTPKGIKVKLAHVKVQFSEKDHVPDFLKKLNTVFIEDFKEAQGVIRFMYKDVDPYPGREVVLQFKDAKIFQKFLKNAGQSFAELFHIFV